MSFDSAIIAKDARTTTGTSDYTESGFGAPDGSLWLNGICLTRGTRDEHLSLGIGATDKTNSWAQHTVSQDNSTDSVSARYMKTGSVMLRNSFIDTLGLAGDAGYDSAITDGHRVNYSDPETNTWQTTALLMKCDNLAVGTVTLGTQNTAVTETIGFEADVIMIFGVCNTTLSSNEAHSLLSQGFVTWDGTTLRQCSVIQIDHDAKTDGDPNLYLSSTRCGGQIAGGTVGYTVEAGNITSTAFDLTARDGNSAGDVFGYIAMNVGTNKRWCGVVDTPTSTGNKTFTEPDFLPQFCSFLMSSVESVASVVADATAGSIGMSFFNATDAASHSVSVEDLATTMNTSNMIKSTAAYMDNDDQTDQIEATFTSFENTGPRVNFTNVLTAAKKWCLLAIEDDGGTPSGLAADQYAPALQQHPDNRVYNPPVSVIPY